MELFECGWTRYGIILKKTASSINQRQAVARYSKHYKNLLQFILNTSVTCGCASFFEFLLLVFSGFLCWLLLPSSNQTNRFSSLGLFLFPLFDLSWPFVVEVTACSSAFRLVTFSALPLPVPEAVATWLAWGRPSALDLNSHREMGSVTSSPDLAAPSFGQPVKV